LILRYNSDGSLDNTFGINGIVIMRVFMRNDFGYGVVVQPDGKIVVAGGSWNGNDWDVLVMRFNSDGTPDISFGSYGVVVYDSGSDEESYGIALQQNGEIVVVGYKFSYGLPCHDALIVRYNSDGTLDRTFGEGGITIYNSRLDGLDFGSAVALQPDGKIVVAGYSNTGFSIYEAFVLRYNSNGSLDSTFGEDGVVIYNNFYQDFGYGVAIQPNGKIVVVGEEYGDSLVLRYNSDGTLDRSFGKDGSVTFDSGGYDYSSAVAIQPQGKIVVTGSSNGNTLILRYNNDGLLDSTFGGDGVIFYEGGVNGSGIAVQPDDKIVVTGSSWNYGNNTYDVLTLKLFGNVEYSSVTLLTPNGGEVIYSGSDYTIEWGAPLEMVSFKLKYSMDNGTTWKPIDSGITETSYDWPVPTPLKNKKNCLVKVIGYDGSDKKVGADESDSTFTIEVVKLTWPNGGETLTSGDIPTITWTTHETKRDVARVILKYTQNGGRAWNKIAPLDGNPGSYGAWTVPDVPKTKSKCKVKVVLKDARENTVGSDASDSSFTIEPAP